MGPMASASALASDPSVCLGLKKAIASKQKAVDALEKHTGVTGDNVNAALILSDVF